MQLQTIILAAGQGMRMRSARPKVLHEIGGKPLLAHVHQLASQLGDNDINIIYGHGGERVLETLGSLNARWTEQKERLGTGHAVIQVADWIRAGSVVLILYGDVPFLRRETLEKLIHHAGEHSLGLLTVTLANPSGYGRIIRDEEGHVLRIVEEKDASAEQRMIREVNTGILAIRGAHLQRWVRCLTNDNAQGEYYLTDIIGMAVADGIYVDTSHPEEEAEVLGINDRVQLAQLERMYQAMQANALMEQGVTLFDPGRFDLRGEILDIGQDVQIDVNVVLEGQLRIGSNVRIGPNVYVRDSEIGDDVEIFANSVIENASIGTGCRIGPFARIRPGGTRIAEDVHIGNFVELKKAEVAKGSKINHLSYIGDAVVGAGVNIGAGTIVCNYDGANKHQTIIEDGAFIGSDTQLVAPVRVGKNATIGAGSTITRDAPDDALTLSRSKQVTIEGWQRPVKKRS